VSIDRDGRQVRAFLVVDFPVYALWSRRAREATAATLQGAGSVRHAIEVAWL